MVATGTGIGLNIGIASLMIPYSTELRDKGRFPNTHHQYAKIRSSAALASEAFF